MKSNFSALFLCVIVITFSQCSYQVNPTTGKRELYKKSWSKEISDAQQLRAKVQTELPLLKNKNLHTYINGVAQQISTHTPFKSAKLVKHFPNFNPTVDILFSESIAVFTIPPMHIYLTTGLLAQLQNEAQLAYVISHELAHMAKRPFADRNIQWREKHRNLIDLTTALETALKLNPTFSNPTTYSLFSHIEYSLEAEKEAVDLGFYYAASAGYDSEELSKAAKLLKSTLATPAPYNPYVYSHPLIATTEKKSAPQMASFWIDEEQQAIIGEERYLKAINGVPIRSVQHGYKKDKLVIHPRLGYQFTAASDWAFFATKERIVLTNEDETALLTTLFFKKEGTISSRIYELFAKAGLTPEQAAPITLNGKNRFQASTTTFVNSLEYTLVAGAVELDALHIVLILIAETERFDAFKPYFTEPYTTLIPHFNADTTVSKTNFLKIRVASTPKTALSDSVFSNNSNEWVTYSELFRLNQKNPKDSLYMDNLIKTIQPSK